MGLMVVVLIAVIAVILIIYAIKCRQTVAIEAKGIYDLKNLSTSVIQRLTDEIETPISSTYNERTREAMRTRQRAIRIAMDEASYGIPKNIYYLEAVIQSYLQEMLPNIEACKAVIDFDDYTGLIPNHQWELFMYFAEQQAPKKKHAFTWAVTELGWHEELDFFETEVHRQMKRRIVLPERLSAGVKHFYRELTYNDYIILISRIIYNYSIGCGCIQTLRLTDVDGFNFGTSGSVRYAIDERFDAPYTTTNSVWCQVKAKWIHFAFLDFYSEDECARCISQLTSWGSTPPMTEHRPYKVNDAYDGARITAIRPPEGECWALFCRKFSADSYSLESLLNHNGCKNWELVRDDIYWKMRGEQTVGFTGQQNTGKTSMMKAAMECIRMVNVRVLEMSFELALRELYPWMNVFTIRPTEYVTEVEAQDVLKKTDAYLSLVGEVAQATVAARMIQFCQVASAFTLFSYHSKTDYDYIIGLSNALVQSGEYDSRDIAMSNVLSVIKHNVHLSFVKGLRRIEYISEIIKLDELSPYPALVQSADVPAAIDQLAMLQREYYTRTTDRVRFESRKIIEFNPDNDTYEARAPYSKDTIESILAHLDADEKKAFAKWYTTNWKEVLKSEKFKVSTA